MGAETVILNTIFSVLLSLNYEDEKVCVDFCDWLFGRYRFC